MQDSVDGVDRRFPQERRKIGADVSRSHSCQVTHVERRGDVQPATHHVEDRLPSVLVWNSDRDFTENVKIFNF